MRKRMIDTLPGLVASFLIASVATFLSRWLPQVGAATLALFLGLFLGNTWLKQPFLARGTALAESRLLELAVLLLGASLTFKSVQALGLRGGLFIVLQISITLAGVIILGKKLNFSKNIYFLMASGNAVCGSSAVAATAPVLGAKEEEKGTVIAIVNLLGTVLMLVLPFLTWFLFDQSPLQSGALIGGVLQSMGQVVASSSMVSPAVLETATLFKLLRIISLVLVIFILGRLNQRAEGLSQETESSKNKQRKLIPWYVKGFFLLFLFNSFGWLPQAFLTFFASLGHWLELLALAAIGLRLDFSFLRQQGKKLLLYSGLTATLQIVSALVLIYFIFS